MPAPTTTEAFLDIGYRSGLLQQSAVDELHSTLNGHAPTTPRELAKVLIDHGMLTRFQAEKLLNGRWRGFVIAGKYRLLERLGAGGMGEVYLCEHIHMGRRVAIKVLPIAQAQDPTCLARFYREARAVARLDHPNIVRAHDIDREDKLHFIVLEFVDGCNLHEFVRRNGVLCPIRAAHYIRQAALGLQHAHEAGLVHRDIKPGNLLLDRQGTVKILDMGLARFFHEDSNAYVTEYETGYIIGTADYLAPEQVIDSRVDIRADIYGLGGTLYYLLAGKSPFQEGSAAQKMIWQQVRMPKSVLHYRPEIPVELVEVLVKMMAKEPSRRHQTPGEVADALAPLVTTPIEPPTAAELPPMLFAQSERPSTQVKDPTTPHSPGTMLAPEAPSSNAAQSSTGSGTVVRSFSIRK
jgi:eukaryotic-like serine/threonine-protein kinase